MLTMKYPASAVSRIIVNAKYGNSVFSRDLGASHARYIIFQKIYNAGVGKLLISIAPFLGAVLHVIFASARAKVGRVNAQRVITRMENVHSSRNLALRFFVRKSMRQFLAYCRSQRVHAVPLVVDVASPYPASVRLQNFGPKAFAKHVFSSLNIKLIDDYGLSHKKSRVGV